ASSSAAASLATQNPTVAALGTPLSAELHELRVIATSPREYATQTRFIILGRRSGPPSGNDNTMLMIHSKDRVGALMEVLQVFASRNVNVRQIENRPTTSGAEARFFLEISGHHSDTALQQAITGHSDQVRPLDYDRLRALHSGNIPPSPSRSPGDGSRKAGFRLAGRCNLLCHQRRAHKTQAAAVSDVASADGMRLRALTGHGLGEFLFSRESE
ncbi:MAG: hypothetical protein B7Z47_04185, partial [Chthoniobacter sp. 12-60-6]